MEKLAYILFLLISLSGFSLSAATIDDEKIEITFNKIKNKLENKKPIHPSKKDQEDTLINKSDIKDTLTFDDKAIDDTLIFADDEMLMKINTDKNKDINIFPLSSSLVLDPIIYPNPSLGIATLQLNTTDNSITEITITSHEGTIIKNEKVIGNNYELNGLAAGKYIVTIKSGNQTVQKRLFVK